MFFSNLLGGQSSPPFFTNECGLLNNEAEVRVAEIGNQLWKWNLDVTPGEVRDQTIHREVRAGRIFGIAGGREREVTGEMEQTAEQPPLLLRAEEVAQMLGLGRSKVYEMMAKSELPVVRIGTAVRVPRKALEAWIDEHTNSAA